MVTQSPDRESGDGQFLDLHSDEPEEKRKRGLAERASPFFSGGFNFGRQAIEAGQKRLRGNVSDGFQGKTYDGKFRYVDDDEDMEPEAPGSTETALARRGEYRYTQEGSRTGGAFGKFVGGFGARVGSEYRERRKKSADECGDMNGVRKKKKRRGLFKQIRRSAENINEGVLDIADAGQAVRSVFDISGGRTRNLERQYKRVRKLQRREGRRSRQEARREERALIDEFTGTDSGRKLGTKDLLRVIAAQRRLNELNTLKGIGGLAGTSGGGGRGSGSLFNSVKGEGRGIGSSGVESGFSKGWYRKAGDDQVFTFMQIWETVDPNSFDKATSRYFDRPKDAIAYFASKYSRKYREVLEEYRATARGL